MHHAPEPHVVLTIPSIHDDTKLDCRIYHPDILSRPLSATSEERKRWRPRGIVMAHPYAPMGGSFDDRIVGLVVAEFLASGYIVGTFNFRGAHGSKGRTSWSGKPELDDYISFAAFFMHYLSHLRVFPSPTAKFSPDQSPLLSPVSKPTDAHRQNPVVILGGYSYGSMILRHLPPVPSILQPFSTPLKGSSASEIILRAHRMSDQDNLQWINLARERERRNGKGPKHENKLSVTMGGEETSPDQRRSSREIRRSMDGRRSLDIGDRLRSLSHRGARDGRGVHTPPEENRIETAIQMPDVRYLLISPLTAPVSTLAAPGLGPRLWSKEKDNEHEIIGKHITLAVNGDQDIFASAKKVQLWAENLSKGAGSRFSHVEIKNAGHFWVEDGVAEQLKLALRNWEMKARD